ncbi:MAG: hypothetical protein ACSHWS_13195, partial [Sulfitobacter sp.]
QSQGAARADAAACVAGKAGMEGSGNLLAMTVLSVHTAFVFRGSCNAQMDHRFSFRNDCK